MPLWIHIDEDKDKDDKKGWIHLAQKFDSKDEDGEGNYLEYETGRSNSADNGVFIDRAFLYTNESGSTTTTTIIRRGWKMEAVEGKTTPTSYILTATVQTHLQVLIRPISITSSQPRHKATWTKTAVPW